MSLFVQWESGSAVLDGRTVIGKGEDAGLKLADEYASAHHAVLSPGGPGGGWYAEDLGSTNGTWVNGVKTWDATPSGQVMLRKGDKIRVGRTVLTVVPA